MDGAMGTSLIARGIPKDTCLEELNESNPALILEIHRGFISAGAQVIVTNTFGANRVRLANHVGASAGWPTPLQERVNRKGIQIAREAAAGKAAVFASIGPGGDKEQVVALEKEVPDGFLVETMTSLQDAAAIARAVREVSDRLLIVSLTFPRGAGGFVGAPANTSWRAPLHEEISRKLRSAGADVIGYNCGAHPKEAYEFLSALKEVDPGPWLARPAAGTPENLVSPEEFAEWGKRLAALGVTYLGGCCGTTPGHIRALKDQNGSS